VHIGDPLEDLGWLCTKTWRFGATAPVGGLGSHDALLAGYREAGGPEVPLDVLHWWELLGSLKWGVICMMQASRHFAGPPSVELAAIGRRVAEVEWDLLGMLP
ncbi:MAG: phosphotransferase family protein, partial [Acidimicrobiales bacterium]